MMEIARKAVFNRNIIMTLLFIPILLLTGCSGSSNGSKNPSGSDPTIFESGTASWYGEDFQGLRTASDEIFDMNKLTAAHRTLSFGSYVEVENQTNGRRVTVKINDRGPTNTERIIDLSKRAASELGFLTNGTATVALRLVSG